MHPILNMNVYQLSAIQRASLQLSFFSWFRLWRTDQALCQWSKETAALPPSTPLTTPSSPPPPPWKRWTNAGQASSRKDSMCSSMYILYGSFGSFRISKFAVCFPFFLCCSYILLELVETERDYVRDLGLVVEVS